ncbi:MAG: OmpH family outer membrane protein [Bacteroidetes bacterium]|nr:OmpH family outer membrane protein [Bacteroidota bacterium]MBS1609747.1 OmpH family outer membrane protein [Bacteroidota bacterium]
MKKIISVFAIALVFLAAASSVNAQKIGHIRADDLIQFMPEAQKIDTLLQRFQVDSLNPQYASLVQDYIYKDSLLNKTDTSKMPANVKNQIRGELQQLTGTLQNWQQTAQQIMGLKQQQLAAPMYKRISDAINAVAKEKGYTYVLTSEALIVAPPSDDMLPAVAAKLGIKLPSTTGNKPAVR